MDAATVRRLCSEATFISAMFRCSISIGAVGPKDAIIVGDHNGAREFFDTVVAEAAPGWRVESLANTATDMLCHVCFAAANVRGMARAHDLGMPFVLGKVAVARGCWGGGRGFLAFASLQLRSKEEREYWGHLWGVEGKPNQLVALVELPYRERATTFGPPDEALTASDREALAALEACLTREPIGALLLEPWRFPGGGSWLTPAVYQSVRAMCTRLGVAIVMDEAGSACRTGRFLAHEWLLPEGAGAAMRPDAVVLGKGVCVGALLLPTQPTPATEIPYVDSVTSGGPALELLQGATVLRHLLSSGALAMDRQRRLHEACAAEAAALMAARPARSRTAAAAPLAVWGTCSVWYRSAPPTGSPASLWSEAHGHARVVLPVDIEPADAPARLR